LKFFPELVPAAVAYGTAINCGVVGFTKDADIFRQWYDKALIGRDFFIADETCAQLLLPHVQHKIVSDDYNKSCKYGQLTDTTKIIHYHGKKHCRTVGNDYVYKGELWVRVYQEIVSLNVCDIQTWQPAGDIRLKRLMQNINISKPQRHIFDNFDKCFYINLDHRQDKNDLIQTELNKHGIVAERVSGIDDKNKKQGCTLSHIKVLKLAQEQKLDSILIMEDDVKFHDDIKEVSIAIRNFLQKNPWDIIFFHISNATKFINGPIKLDNKYKIIRTNGARGTQCYAVRHTAYDAIISELSKRPWKYNDGTMMKHICRKFITYGITPVLAGQRCDTISDIKNKTNGKDWIFASEWPERY
jgi:GR25 family glycosyltransferase involved in LPS biosynthesis